MNFVMKNVMKNGEKIMATFRILKSETGTDMLINLDNVNAIFEFDENISHLYFNGDEQHLPIQGDLKTIRKQIDNE